MDKKVVVHLYNGIVLGHGKEGNLTLAIAWKDLVNIMLSEISQSGKDKYYMLSLICGI